MKRARTSSTTTRANSGGKRAGPHQGVAISDVRSIRRFNRAYTQRIGALSRSFLGSPFTLTESRVLYEMAHHQDPTAAQICRALGLDQGYLSRILRRFEHDGLLARTRSESDGRASHLALTKEGRAALVALDAAATAQVAEMLAGLDVAARRRLVGAMNSIETILSRRASRPTGVVLRAPRAGDLGWIVDRHGAIYAATRAWDQRFEGLVATVVAEFAERGDRTREQCWIAEYAGERCGSVLLVRRSKTTAQLRLLLVEPEARGRGIGRALVEACVDFARRAGYRTIVLWTDAGLVAARRLYESAGFRLRESVREHRFSAELVSQTWELRL